MLHAERKTFPTGKRRVCPTVAFGPAKHWLVPGLNRTATATRTDRRYPYLRTMPGTLLAVRDSYAKFKLPATDETDCVNHSCCVATETDLASYRCHQNQRVMRDAPTRRCFCAVDNLALAVPLTVDGGQTEAPRRRRRLSRALLPAAAAGPDRVVEINRREIVGDDHAALRLRARIVEAPLQQ
jgi:hypothetical protein